MMESGLTSDGRPENPWEASPVLERAWRKERGPTISEVTRQALLSIARFEGGWGNSSYRRMDGTRVDAANNWGAIHCPRDSAGGQRTVPRPGELWTRCVHGSDRKSATGQRFPVYFRAYPTPELGARDFLRVLAPVLDSGVMETGNADAIARAMKPVYRYGVTIDEYAHAIDVNAAANAQSGGWPNRIHREAAAPRARGAASIDLAFGAATSFVGLAGLAYVGRGQPALQVVTAAAGAGIVAFYIAETRELARAG